MRGEINVGLLGLGTVGSGVYKILTRHKENFRQKIGTALNLKRILEKNMARVDELGVDHNLITNDFSTIVDDPGIDIIVEVIGGIEPARTFILQALDKGKHIVTANKELMASQGEEILKKADAKGLDVYFEASVGGGIPIVRPLKQCLMGNKISRVMGIVNGTTNFILTQMSEANCPFDKALEEAQKRGYAERDPSADIEGHDAAAKIAILASIAFNSRVTSSQVYTEGISNITPQDIAYAREIGCVVKLIALAKEEDSELEVRVHPTMIPCSHPLASVEGVYNAIFVVGDAVGEVMFFGQGAGSMPAASAIVGDIIDIARNLQYGSSGRIGCTCFETKKIKAIDEINSSYYLLMNVHDRPGVLAQIAKAFGDNNVSLASVIQKGQRGKNAELMFTTHLVKEKHLRSALEVIRKLPVVNEICNVIRVEGAQSE
jgi:homoserine dehydrogenase